MTEDVKLKYKVFIILISGIGYQIKVIVLRKKQSYNTAVVSVVTTMSQTIKIALLISARFQDIESEKEYVLGLRRGGKMLEALREKALRLPLKPGVYIMLDENREVIYVGKAKKLKNRVSSYFRGSHDAKTTAMVSKVADFDVIIANSEFEALVLENSLIKRHKPYYNILLKDDKGYPFVRLDLNEEYPAFSMVNKLENDGARYFGPFGGRNLTREVISALCKTFKLPTCSRKFPRDIGKGRPCLNFHMGACDAYCRGEPGAEEYRRNINEAVMVLEGKTAELCERLEQEMVQAAEELKFELAAEKRDKLKAIQRLETKQRVVSARSADSDVVGFVRGETKSCFVVLHYIGGSLLDKDVEIIENPMEEDGEAVSSLLRQYYSIRGVYPKNIYLPCETEDNSLLEQLFSEEAGRSVHVSTPQKGEKKRLVETANLNAREELNRITSKEEKVLKTLKWLKEALGLENYPERIEAYDISNTGSSEIVSSMTVFEGLKPLKKAYRKFKIKGTETADDYYSMSETLSRRFERYLKGDEKFDTLPDIILIDGGAAHANTAKKVLEEKGIDIPVFGMVKDERHRTRALVTPDGKEIGISASPAVFSFIGRIQEETHRFAISYHRQLRSSALRGSELDRIPSVGEKRKAQLLKHFKSIKAIRSASLEELCEVVPKNVAASVYDYYHRDEVEENESNNGNS